MYRSRKHHVTKIVHIAYGRYAGGGNWFRTCDSRRVPARDRSWVPGTAITCFKCLAWMRENPRERVS